MRLDGKSAVVTGAATGLGRSTALLLAKEGAGVVIADVEGGGAAATASEITSAGGRAVVEERDVSIESDVDSMISRAVSEFGGLDILVNNAAIQEPTPLHNVTNEELERQLEVNVRGVFFGCRRAVQVMREAGGGSIVNSGSILSMAGDPNVPVYVMTKHAVLGLTRAIAVGYASEGIRCNCVCAGDMETPMLTRYWDASPDPTAARAEMDALYPRGRIAHPDEVAQVIAFVASDEASFVNGAAIAADGGLLALAPGP